MSPLPASSAARRIVWPSVITVISAAILIGAEVFGAAFAGGWALAILLGLDLGKRRRLERRLPRLEQRICASFGSGCRLQGF